MLCQKVEHVASCEGEVRRLPLVGLNLGSLQLVGVNVARNLVCQRCRLQTCRIAIGNSSSSGSRVKPSADKAFHLSRWAVILIFTDLERQKAVTELEKFQLSSAQQTFPYQLGAQKASLQNLQDTHKLNKIAMQVQQQSLRQMRSDFDWLNQMRPMQLSKLAGEVQTQLQQIKESDARIAELTKQLDYINAKIAETGASTENIEQRTKIERELSEYQKRTASAEAVQSEVTSTLARFGMPENIAGRTAALLSSGQLSPREFERSLQSINYYFKNGERVLKEDAAGYLKYVYDPTDVKDRDFWSKQLWNALDIGAKGLGVYQLTKPKAGAAPIRGFSK